MVKIDLAKVVSETYSKLKPQNKTDNYEVEEINPNINNKKNPLLKIARYIIIGAASIPFLANINNAQTININVSGTTKDITGNPLPQTELIFQQYVEPNWIQRGTDKSNEFGEFNKTLDQITDVKQENNISPVNYLFLQNRFLDSPIQTKITTKTYNAILQEIPGSTKEILITPGRNKLPDQ
ncbi:hypothetical protein K9L67_04730, partial [Candidatus Woesearchaeota archaeon]|nr:hypothetical protein [Candidatus Woesearchaeota archaeon]MCF8013927.1 hypothetical protein [Candidatus Woesearchaeota archaeon]